jgi:hypothetical protein
VWSISRYGAFVANYEGYSESNLRWAVNNTSNEKIFLLLTKNKYSLQLYHYLITAGIETFVITGNKLLYACVKELCRLWD